MVSALELIGRDLQAKRVSFAAYDMVRHGLEISNITFGWDGRSIPTRFFPLNSPCQSVQAYYSVKPLWLNKEHSASSPETCMEHDLFDDELLIAPMIIQNRPVGLLYVGDISSEARTRVENEVSVYAAILALLVEDHQLITVRAKKQSALVSLLHSTRSFMTAKDIDEMLAGIVEEAARLTSSKIAVLITHRPHAKDIKIEHSIGLPEAFLVSSKHILEGKQLINDVLSKKYLHLPDLSGYDFEEPWYTLVKVAGITSFIGAVIPADTKQVRELLLFMDSSQPWTVEDTDLLLGFLNQSGIALTNADYFSELQKATRSAARSRDKLDLILEHIGECIFTIDKGMRINSANRSFFKTFDLAKGKVIGKTCFEVLGGGQQRCPLCPAMDVFEKGEIVGPRIVRLVGNGGDEREFEVFIYPISDEFGATNQAIVAMRDLACFDRSLTE